MQHRFAGSAPRVRGTGRDVVEEPGLRRFSPACAGNGGRGQARSGSAAVQPRVCGERRTSTRTGQSNRGSAPRVRGTERALLARQRSNRFSPACAGNGDRRCRRRRRPTVQPRVCGERVNTTGSTTWTNGSAPRVRGTETYWLRPRWQSRFSPACAGNGWRLVVEGRGRAVQPRVCGERTPSFRALVAADGSAPRVRGTVWAFRQARQTCRFSPACAGNGP